MSEREMPFYGKWIYRDREQQYIKKILHRYRQDPVTDELKKTVYDTLMHEKHLGRVTIPFRVVLRRDIYGKYPDYIEVILDTKV